MAEAKPKRTKRSDGAVVQVVRDSTFHRVVVDNALQVGREIRSVQSQGEGATLATVETLTEVVRLRLSWPTATNLAMNILANGIRSNRLNGSVISEELAALSAKGGGDDS